MKRLLCIASFAALLGAASALPYPSLAAEFPIGTIIGRAVDHQDMPAVAYGNGVILVVWHDRRSEVDYDIYGTRVTLDGQVLDPKGIPISVAAFDQRSPCVAWNGTNFLVAWSDKRAGSSSECIYGARVSAEGQVLDPEGILLSSSTTQAYNPAAASDGSSWFVVWEQQLSLNIGVCGAVVSGDGSVAPSKQISSWVCNQSKSDVAWNGSCYMVVWEDDRNGMSSIQDIYGNLCDTAGQPVYAQDILVSSAPGSSTTGATGAQTGPSIASDGSSFFAVWTDARDGSIKKIYGARLNSSGTLIDRGGILIASGAESQEFPAVARNQDNYIVVWRSKPSRTCKGARVTSGGSVLDPTGFTVYSSSIASTGPDIGGSGSQCYAAVSTYDISNMDVYGVSVRSTGIVPNPAGTLLSTSQQHQESYSIAWNGYTYVVAWSDKRWGSKDIYVSRITAGGQVLDPEGIRLTTDTYSQSEPAIASNGNGFLVAWTDNVNSWTTGVDIRGMCLDRRGLPTGSAFNICSMTYDQGSPAVGSRGSDYLVVWRDWRSAGGGTYYADLYGARVTPPNTLYTYATPVSNAADDQLSPQIASDSSNYLVVWDDRRSGAGDQIYACRVSSTSILDPSGVQVSTSPGYTPCVAWSGSNYLVCWADYRNGFNLDIYGVRLNQQAVRLDAQDIEICGPPLVQQDQLDPSIVWDGGKYLVCWADYRASGGNPDIFMTPVTSAGVVESPSGVQVTSSSMPDIWPKIAAWSQGYAVIAFGRTQGIVTTLYGTQYGPPIYGAPTGTLKSLPDGTTVCLTDRIVTVGNDLFSGCFYIEEPDRSSGIKVISGVPCQIGNWATVVGTLNTVGGERQIDASWVVVTP